MGARPHALFCVSKPFFLRAAVLSCHRDSHPTLDEMEMSTKKNFFCKETFNWNIRISALFALQRWILIYHTTSSHREMVKMSDFVIRSLHLGIATYPFHSTFFWQLYHDWCIWHVASLLHLPTGHLLLRNPFGIFQQDILYRVRMSCRLRRIGETVIAGS